jgi:hypothetical protein
MPSMTIFPFSREMVTSSPLEGGGAAATLVTCAAQMSDGHTSRRRPKR